LRSLHRFLGHESGSALVETALTVPFLLLIVLGAVEFARVAGAAIEISSAAKAGVAYGSQNFDTVSDLPGIQQAAVNDVGNIQGLTFSSTNVQAAVSGACSSGKQCTGKDYGYGPTCTSDDCGVGDHAETILHITTSGTIDPMIHVPWLPRLYTVQGYAAQTVLQP
jgi:Flp pilus assembly protein TadG